MEGNRLVIVGPVSGREQRLEITFIAEVASIEQRFKSLALQSRTE